MDFLDIKNFLAARMIDTLMYGARLGDDMKDEGCEAAGAAWKLCWVKLLAFCYKTQPRGSHYQLHAQRCSRDFDLKMISSNLTL